MDKIMVKKLQNQFDDLAQRMPETDMEFWFARDLQRPLGYTRWENFLAAIRRAIESCKTTGYEPDDHFRGVTKMVALGSGAERPIEDFMLTRNACYLIAQNGDPRKEPIAFAQSYFALQTRKQELLEDRMQLIARMDARTRLRESEKTLSQNIYERGVDERGFGRIRSKGDAAHIAISTVHNIDYLLTWNCRHLDNAETKPIIRSICAVNGYICPEICTPVELMGEK